MEHHRQSGTPVNLNALLIGEKTVPKGCRVMHVSSHGMLLHCEPDGQPRTFSDGDSLDIHLTVQHNGEQKKLTIPSHVRHVAENSLDVEFHHPDPVLLDLIESYRVSESHTLEAAVGDIHSGDPQPEAIPPPGSHLPDKETQAAMASPDSGSGSRRARIPGLAVLLGLAGILVGAYYYMSGLQQRISALEVVVDYRGNELVEMQNKVFSASLLDGKYASLNARINALGNTIASLERRINTSSSGATASIPENREPTGVITPAVAADTTPAPEPAGNSTGAMIIRNRAPGLAAKTDNSGEIRQTSLPPVPESPTAEPAELVETETPLAVETGIETETDKPDTTPTPAFGNGPWVINLMSSLDRQYLEKVARRAESRDIMTELNSAKIKGRNYWRLQVPGFNSLAAAKSRAVEIKQSLGIGDVWFLKRKPDS